MADFTGQDLSGSRFERVDLTGPWAWRAIHGLTDETLAADTEPVAGLEARGWVVRADFVALGSEN